MGKSKYVSCFLTHGVEFIFVFLSFWSRQSGGRVQTH